MALNLCFIYYGGDNHEHEFGVIIDSATQKSLSGYYGISEGVLKLKLKGTPLLYPHLLASMQIS